MLEYIALIVGSRGSFRASDISAETFIGPREGVTAAYCLLPSQRELVARAKALCRDSSHNIYRSDFLRTYVIHTVL